MYHGEDISLFYKSIDELAISVKKENAAEVLNNITIMYELLPRFAEQIDKGSLSQQVLNSKYNLLLCYKYANTEDWEGFSNSLKNLEQSFSKIQNKKSEYAEQEVNINTASLIIREMNNTAEVKEKDIFFIKYKNLMQEFNVLLQS